MESNNPWSQIEISESEHSVFKSSIQDMCRLENVQSFSPLQSTLGFMSSRPEIRDDQILDNGVHGTNFSDQPIGLTELPPYQDSDPMILLNNLVFLEKKVLDLKGVVKSMNHERLDLSHSEDISIDSRQQMVVSEIASIISYMISIGRKLLNLNQKKGQGNSCSNLNPVISKLGNLVGADGSLGAQNSQEIPNSCFEIVTRSRNQVEEKLICPIQEAEVDSDAGLDVAEAMKDENGDGEGENLLSSPGCYEVCELEKEEILAPHTHFCVICNKGFKRDANLRMHMRGHGEIFKTAEALANPNKGTKVDLINSRRYSCPFEGCKRNRKHKKFQPLKTILCVKNHYKRSHCDKSYICSRCKCKKFSVIADLKTHEKHCGEDKWKCSCGTTFSRKDKLFGHVSLFHGHTPVLPMKEVKRCKISEEGKNTERKDTDVSIGSKTSNFNCGFNSNEGAQVFLGTGSVTSVPSEDLSCGRGYDQPLFADTPTQNQEMENNFNPGTSENPKPSSILMDDFFSFESILSCSFIGPDLEDFLSDKSMIL